MFYYKAKDGRSTLALRKPLTAENYPEYTQEMIEGYEEAAKEEVCPSRGPSCGEEPQHP